MARTPWGESQSSKVIAPGITFHSTAGHGGFHLAPERQNVLQRKFRFETFAGGPWYEEDCDAVAVAIAFPDAFKAASVLRAIESANHFHSWEIRDGVTGGKWRRVLDHCEKNPFIQSLLAEALIP